MTTGYSPMTDAEFFKNLIYPARVPYHGAVLPWRFVGSSAYLRAHHGVFKLEPWVGDVHDHFAGLQGTYTSHAGAQDRIVFEFHELLAPDRSALKNADLADTHRIYAWHKGSGARREIEWYVPPISTGPLHDAIANWIAAWGGP
jgi:hypothetical protein